MEQQTHTPLEPLLQRQFDSPLLGSIAFLLLSLPMGITAFTLTVTGLSLGVGTLIIWMGLPILFITLLCVRGLAEVERRLVSSMLRIPLPYQFHQQNASYPGFLRSFGSLLRDPYTWTSTAYMLIIKLPLGIVNFTLALTLPLLSWTLTLLPLVYLVNVFINLILLRNGIPGSSILIPGFIEIHGFFDPVAFVHSFVGVPVGLLIWFATRALLLGLARLSGELALAMLGSGAAIVAQPRQDLRYTLPVMEQEQRL